VAVMDTRSGRSGGYNLKGPLECTFYRNLPRSAGHKYIVFAAAIRGDLGQTQARGSSSELELDPGHWS
jgi:hypothetical protein